MKAVITNETDAVEFNVDEWHVGDYIEVLGFVFYGECVRAIWRDDEGRLNDLPIWAIRMVPNTDAAENRPSHFGEQILIDSGWRPS